MKRRGTALASSSQCFLRGTTVLIVFVSARARAVFFPGRKRGLYISASKFREEFFFSPPLEACVFSRRLFFVAGLNFFLSKVL